MQPIFNNPVFSGRPHSIYGKTLKWYGSDQQKNYKPQENLYGPNDIDYTFNKHGFRCDEFIDADTRIVFLGCSITEGIGLPYEKVWAYQILEMIRKDTGIHIPYWNLSMGGCGLDAIVRAYYHYHDILKPHIVLAFLPGYRREIFIPEHGNNVPFFIHAQEDIWERYSILIDPRNIHYETEKNLAMLSLMLDKYNTEMFWNSWGYEHYPRDFQHRNKLIIKWDKKGRDNMHPGADAHTKFAREIYSLIRNDLLSKIKSIGLGGS